MDEHLMTLLTDEKNSPTLKHKICVEVWDQVDVELTHLNVPGGDDKRDPDMDYIGCLGSNGQHSQILPFRVTFIVVTRYKSKRCQIFLPTIFLWQWALNHDSENIFKNTPIS